MAASSVVRRFIPPPTMGLLPRRRARTTSMLSSTGLHGVMLAALIWLPALFPSPIFIHLAENKPAAPADFEPLVAPGLPHLEDRGSGSRASSAGAPGSGSGPVRSQVTPPAPKPDYVAPQEIVSIFPDAVNRVQTIRRPDLVAPPKMKFPIKLQSMVVLPPPTAPVLTAPPQEQPKQPVMPIPTTHEEIPVDESTVQNPALTLTPKRILPVPAETAPPQAVAPNTPTLAEAQVTPPRSVVVVNAVAVPPDPAAAIPNAELAGNFVVGPATSSSNTEKPSAAAGSGKPSEGGTGHSGEGSSHAGLENGTGAGSGAGHAPGTGSGTRASAGGGSGTGGGKGNGSAATGTGTGSGTGTGKGPGVGGGTGTGSSAGSGSGNGAPGSGSGSGTGTGISITGGVPGRGSTISRAMPTHRSYGMMIISGGNNGGASRDVGVFDRSETVYSVAIPMADAGGGTAWTMQYAIANPAQASAGMLVPPFAQKKVPATMPKTQFTGELGPIFIAAIIDENGKLQSLRSIRAQDARSQPAIHALQQWEFLPAQLDGKPVATKVLLGVTVTPE